jgi:ribose transport system ATP-binding protein
VDLEIAPGEIHCLLGQNGSGKSTLAKILSGYHAPDKGASLEIDGELLSLPVLAADVHRLGMSFVHQNLGLVDAYSVLENVRIGRFRAGRVARKINWKREFEVVRAVLLRLGSDIDPTAPVAQLSPSERAIVAIARAIQGHQPGHGLIVFDESTRSLPPEALAGFYALVRSLLADGTSILLVSHRLDEVLRLGDRVTVLRDGRVVEGGLDTSALSEQDLVRLMLGRTLQALPERRREPQATAPDGDGASANTGAGLAVRGLVGGRVRGLSLDIQPGEIVGITGLTGSGFEDVPSLLSGVMRGVEGTVTVGAITLDVSRGLPRHFLAAGIALVPERRDLQGLALAFTVLENVTLPRVRQRGSALHLGKSWQVAEAHRVVESLGVVPRDITMPVAHLSGGNQQKVLMGKWLLSHPQVLILHEPTQGVDVGARVDLLKLVDETARGGCAVLIASAEQEDLSVLCDRVIVVRDGVATRELQGPTSVDDIVGAIYAAAPTATTA